MCNHSFGATSLPSKLRNLNWLIALVTRVRKANPLRVRMNHFPFQGCLQSCYSFFVAAKRYVAVLGLRFEKQEAFLYHRQTLLVTSALDSVTTPNRMMDVPFVGKFSILECSPKRVFRNWLPCPHKAGRPTRSSTVIPATGLINGSNLTSRGVGVGDKNVIAFLRH